MALFFSFFSMNFREFNYLCAKHWGTTLRAPACRGMFWLNRNNRRSFRSRIEEIVPLGVMVMAITLFSFLHKKLFLPDYLHVPPTTITFATESEAFRTLVAWACSLAGIWSPDVSLSSSELIYPKGCQLGCFSFLYT